MKVVLFPYILYLDNVEFHEDFSVKTGRVINGGWDYESTKDIVLCWGYREKSNSLPVTEYIRNKQEEYVVVVPVNYQGDFKDYNEVIRWAETQKPSSVEEIELAKSQWKAWHLQKKQEHRDLFDDDIPF